MSNDSATAGFLALASGLASQDQEDAVQGTIAALANLTGPMVRPRWQAKPPKQPADHEDWCAFGVIDEQPEGHQLIHDDDVAVLHAESRLVLMASFYGPGAYQRAKATAHGLKVAQNRVALAAAGLVVVEVGGIVNAPELVGRVWITRFDLTVQLRRGDSVAVPIRNLTDFTISVGDGETAATITALGTANS